MVAVAILAAGRGTRMKSDLPKVLHRLGGRSLIERVLDSVIDLNPDRRLVIVGYRNELVQAALEGQASPTSPVEFVEQAQQLGTGHAVKQLLPHLKNFTGDLLVLNGDVPLLRPQTLQKLLKTHQENGNAATVLTAQLANPKGYGRVFCDGQNRLTQIVEDRDCAPMQRQNQRVNAGVYCFRWSDLAAVLPKLTSHNSQQEYYLTDTVNYLNPVMIMDIEDPQEILGINDRKQLALADQILQTRIKDEWMMRGVRLIDPPSITIDETVSLEADVVIEPQTHLRGNTSIKAGSRIGPGTLIENSQIAENVTILYSVIANSTIQSDSQVGPYAHLRGPVEVGHHCRLGNFVELKNTQLGDHTKVAHLSYLGDATVGQDVNVAGGMITANYDGVRKHRTTIGDRSKTGVHNVLVAPITIGSDVTIAAGSTITEDLPDDCLAIARARQVVKPGWRLQPKPPQDNG
jgi:bifunctional UDP-N-acetylglucosamine pyrophosphorylase / glucosamine-1-phosphate N-acetyltransferase